MNISILKDYRIFDAGSKSSVERILEKLSIKSSDVTLDLSNCIIDYPATSLIIDRVLLSISQKRKPGKLKIQTHLNIMEILLLHWLFIGSSFFKIDDSKKGKSLNDLKLIMQEKLLQKKIVMEIEVIDKQGRPLKKYIYGSK
jgi:hypothetical protein